MATSIESRPVSAHNQQASREQLEQQIHHKHQHHHNFHGAHQHVSEKERLKKHLLHIERMLYAESENDDEDSQDVKDDLHRQLNDHVKSSIDSLKNEYGIKDDQMDHVSNIVDTDHTLATQGDIVLSGGIAVLYLFMNLLSDLAQYKYLEMQQKAKVLRDSQNMANEVNEIIADVSKQKTLIPTLSNCLQMSLNIWKKIMFR